MSKYKKFHITNSTHPSFFGLVPHQNPAGNLSFFESPSLHFGNSELIAPREPIVGSNVRECYALPVSQEF
jgi:hypothetical protein